MNLIFAIAAGGASGALLRYWISSATHAVLGRGFPYGTLAVNLLGCLLMGFLTIWLLERTSAGPAMRAFLLIGLLGAFTTFSTFTIETMTLIESGQVIKAVMNILLSVVLCVSATAFGLLIGRQL